MTSLTSGLLIYTGMKQSKKDRVYIEANELVSAHIKEIFPILTFSFLCSSI